MPKVKLPLHSGDARGQFGKKIIFTKGGYARRYFRPRNPNTIKQQNARQAFLENYVAGLTKEQADLLYAAIEHLHDERYLQNVPQQDHGGLSGLGDDDHEQYFNEVRGDARYIQDAGADGKLYGRKNNAWVEVPSSAMVLIADSVLSSSQASFDFQSIPATYKHLKLIYSLRSDRASFASDRVKVVCNNDTASNAYESILYYWFNANTWGTIDPGFTTAAAVTFVTASTALANSFGGGFIEFVDYANTSRLKLFQTRGGQMQSTTIKPEIYDGMAVWRSTSAINRITVSPVAGSNFVAGSRISLYGVN